VAKRWSRKAPEQPLDVRRGSTVKRDAYKAATAGLTGVTAFAALAVTGAVAGAAAHQKAAQDAAKARPTPPPAGQAVAKRRVHRTVVRTRVVHVVSSGGVARPTTGGTLTTPRTSTHTSSSAGSSTTPTAPKPAAPAPAPSSGS